jgi:hypothetical protein
MSNCIVETEYALRILIPVCNTVIGILTFINNDNLLDDNGKYQVHVVTATVNIILMILALVNELLKNRFETIKNQQNPNKIIPLIAEKIETDVKTYTSSFWSDLIPFKVKLH